MKTVRSLALVLTAASVSFAQAPRRRPSVPVVRAQPPMVGPLFSPELLRRVLLRHRASLLRCEQLGTQHTATFGGRVRLHFVIQADGSVLGARITESTLLLPDVEQCVLEVFRSLRFPATDGGGILTIQYPLWFPLGSSH